MNWPVVLGIVAETGLVLSTIVLLYASSRNTRLASLVSDRAESIAVAVFLASGMLAGVALALRELAS